MEKKNTPLLKQDTYVFADVSNIRSSCLKTLDFLIDFVKLLDYFKRRYPNLKAVRYYEGIASDDEKKRKMFRFLGKQGYIICPLERKSYIFKETKEADVKCPKCKHKWTAEIVEEHLTMKSNVDVYLATQLLRVAHFATEPTHIILVSCDGDYAEMIKDALENENVTITVLATPMVRNFARSASASQRLKSKQACFSPTAASPMKKNTLSVRLKELRILEPRFKLYNIENIRQHIEADPDYRKH